MSDTSVVADAKGNPVLVKNESVLPSETPPPPTPPEPKPDPLQPSVKPENVSWDEWGRRQNAVKGLAREFDELDRGDIKEFLEGKVNRDLNDEEIDQIRNDIAAHRISDIADIFDSQLRSTVDQMKRSRRTVRVSAPRGWTKRAFNHLDQTAIEQVCAQLVSRGHDLDTIKDKVVSRVADEETRKAIIQKLDADEPKVES